VNASLARAGELLRAGKPVLIYDADGREEEVDLFFAAEHATPDAVRALRSEAGGLVFLAVDPRIGSALELPFLQDLYAEAGEAHPVLRRLIPNDIKYDKRSSFSLTLNHRQTFTGITDNDRSLTITEFAKLGKRALAGHTSDLMDAFGKSFRAPGHVHLCVGADGLLHTRKGHTEIAVALARLSGVTPVIAGAEMLGEGKARGKAGALDWANRHNTVLLEGKAIEDAWMKLEVQVPASR